MLCEYGYRTAPGWSCVFGATTGHEHINRAKFIMVMFYSDGNIRSVYYAIGGMYLAWNCEGEPIRQMNYQFNDALEVHFRADPAHEQICPLCKWREIDIYDTIKDAPAGFSYKRAFVRNTEELYHAIEILPAPIARAVAKQLPAFTLESWRREFNKKYQRERIADKLFGA